MDSERVKEEYFKKIIEHAALNDRDDLKMLNKQIQIEKSTMRDTQGRNPIDFAEFKFRTTQRDPADVNNLEERYEKFLQEFRVDIAKRITESQRMIWNIENNIASVISDSLEYIEIVRKNLFNQ
ncbi:MAG: hypothetical protein HF309_19235 [Ignavibacteria bacterium]|jgi:hypothetical protein|nr:hypothetical protein [Ignavibacteria bacterium]